MPDEFNMKNLHNYTNPSEKQDLAHLEANTDDLETDKHGFKIKKYPNGLESVRKSVDNCVNLAGLDKKVMEKLLAGEWSHYTTFNSMGGTGKKIVIEYDVNVKKET
tara:strand:+ start:1129 stop:1446 length:318 start_codon:yes stop_codon:yes gene_type:complete